MSENGADKNAVEIAPWTASQEVTKSDRKLIVAGKKIS